MSDRRLYQAGIAAGLVNLALLLVFSSGVELHGVMRHLLFALYLLSFVVFLSVLTTIMRSATSIQSWMPVAAFGGGLASVTINLVRHAIGVVAAPFPPSLPADVAGLAPNLHDTLHNLDSALFFVSLFPLSILLLGAGIVALRHDVLPRWFGWISLISGVLMVPGAVLALTSDNGIVFTLYELWLLLANVSLLLEVRNMSRRANSSPVAHPQQIGT